MRVLLADDHALFREGVRLVMDSLFEMPLEFVEAGDYPQALALARSDPSLDVALVDLYMPGMDGFAGLEALRRAAPNLQVVVVSASDDPGDIRRCLECGARGYVTKSSSSTAMMEGIRSVLAGETFLSPPVGLPAPAETAGPAIELALTPRQRDVLAMLSQGKSNKEIARDLNLAEITVKLHVTAILRSLGVENRTQAAIMAARMGL